MLDTTNTTQLARGTRVRVNGKDLGTVTHFEGAWIGVNLDGEGRRVDLWQRCQLEVVS